ncbi:MAG: FG-GAP repeat protein, partial [Firmicutes bacterium]|nr:FG-GAP repeat protein [Bacillota bacterium]
MNNSKTRGRIRRLLAIWMSLAMVFSAFPAAFFAVYADSAQSDLSTGQAILQQENIVPTELKGSKALPPSVFENDPVLTGADDNGSSPFLLSEYNELFLFRNGGETHDGIKSLGAWYFLGEDENGIDMTRTSLDSDGYSWVETINTENVEAVEPDFSGTRLDDYSFMAGTSFDPLGSGRKQYAAYVGWEETGSGGVMSVMIYDPVSGDYKASVLGNADWVKRADPHYFEMQNVMAITAGDYDGDGKDSLIAFCCGDGSDLRLYEVTYNGTRLSTSEVFNIDAYLVYKDYLNTSEKASFLMRHKPVVSLATGDFDGDGLDEFAYSAGFYNGTNDAEDGWNGKFGS